MIQVISKNETKTKMKCPRCGQTLIFAGVRRYENLSEHVGCKSNNPEWAPGERPTFSCPSCWRDLDYFYDDWGSLYGGCGEIAKKYWCALDSFWFKSWFEVNAYMRKYLPEYEEQLRKEMLNLPDCSTKVRI